MAIAKTRIAAAVSPPIALLAFWFENYLWVRFGLSHPLPNGAAGSSLFFYALFGIPLTYLGAFFLALPAYLLLERRSALRPNAIGAAAVVVGATWALLFVLFGSIGSTLGSAQDVAIWVGSGAVAGGVAGAVFIAIARNELRARAS